MAAQWLVHLPLVLEFPGSIPARGEEKYGIRTHFPNRHLQGKSPPMQVKESYGNLDMVTCRLSSCKLDWVNKYKLLSVRTFD